MLDQLIALLNGDTKDTLEITPELMLEDTPTNGMSFYTNGYVFITVNGLTGKFHMSLLDKDEYNLDERMMYMTVGIRGDFAPTHPLHNDKSKLKPLSAYNSALLEVLALSKAVAPIKPYARITEHNLNSLLKQIEEDYEE